MLSVRPRFCLMAAAAITLGVAAGCDESPPPVPGPRDAGTEDAGSTDAAVDAGAPDAGGPTDGGPDAGAPDGGPLSPRCAALTLDAPVVRATTFVSAEDRVALAVHEDAALVAWVALVDAQPRLSVLRLSSDGAPSVSGAAEDTSEQRDPLIVARETDFLVVWRDDRDGDFELLARRVDAAGVALGSVAVLTDNAADEPRAALGLTGMGTALVAWPDPDGSSAGHVRVLGSDGTPGEASRIAAFQGLRGAPVLASLPTGAALAWVDAATGGVRVQRLSESGAPVGEATSIAADGSASGTVDIARTTDGAVLLFDAVVGGADPQLRYQTLGADASLVDAERVLNPTGRAAARGSLAAFSSGFTVVYQGRDDTADPTLHLALFEPGEDPFESAEVDALSILGGTAPMVRSADDGSSLALAWFDDGRILTAQGRCE